MENNNKKSFGQIVSNFSMPILLLLLMLVFSLLSDRFLTPLNLTNILVQNVHIAICATGVFMILEHSVGIPGRDQVNVTAVLMTLFLAAVYYGARKVLKNGISPIGLIVISAVAGIVVYGIV